MNFFEENCKILIKKHKLNFDIDNFKFGYKYEIEQTKDYKEVLKVHNGDKSFYLGSKYNETKNIEAFINDFYFKDGEGFFIIIGFAMGEHVEELRKKIGKNNRVFIFEPDLEMLKTVMAYKDYSDLLNDERIKIICYEDIYDVKNVFANHISEGHINRIQIKFYTNYDKLYGQKMKIALETIKNSYNVSITNRNTNKFFSNKFMECFFGNLPIICTSSSVNEFKNVFKDKTAVIVSSGPSLCKNIKELKGYEDKVVIICGGRSLSELKENNITPHFVCALDPGDVMNDLMKMVQNNNIPLVCAEQTNYKLLNEYEGEKIFTILQFVEIIKKITGREFGTLTTGGSVAHLCTHFAANLGVKNIILIGQDLAYTDNKHHSKGSSNDVLLGKEEIIDKRNIVYVKGYNEEKIMSSEVFNEFRMWFEDFTVLYKDRVFINSTEGGAHIKGTIQLTLKEALYKYTDEKLLIESNIKKILDRNMNLDFNDVYINLKRLKETAISIKVNCKKGIKIFIIFILLSPL